MEFLLEPTVLAGLVTLILLEIILGIDNLVFIAILADKVEPHQRDKARLLGLSMAVVMRLGLLASISWMVTLTNPLFSVLDKDFSGRDLILLVGGLFLLFKATMELHERLEGVQSKHHKGPKVYAKFWAVVAQIVVLDAVFSIDSVITAVGMVEHLSVMMIAVVIAMTVMIIASKPLTSFVNKHPTVIILCLGFLLMIGFSLIAEGLGFSIPKGYLYAAIGFSVLIEAFNQFARFNKRRVLTSLRPLRERTAEAVLSLLGGKVAEEEHGEEITDMVAKDELTDAFNPAERTMIRSVLSLAERPVKAIMTHRSDVVGIHTKDNLDTIKEKLLQTTYSRLVVFEDDRNDPTSIIQKKDLLHGLLKGEPFNPLSNLQTPLCLAENTTVLDALEAFKKRAAQIAFVVDEFGTFEGLVTLTDILEDIAGDIPEEHTVEEVYVTPQKDGSYIVDGRTDIEELPDEITFKLPEDADFRTVAGLVLHTLRDIPSLGDKVTVDHWELEVVQMSGNRVGSVIIRPLAIQE